MRTAAKKGLLTAVATGSVLASTAGYAYAGSGAEGVAAGSPGVASGNSVQVPVEVPINACGNTVDVIGALNPAYGNNCANASGHSAGGHAGSAASGAHASGTAANSPGVAAGNSVQAPVHIPVNACGNSVDVVGAANPAFGNDCANVAAPAHTPPATPDDDCPDDHGPHNPPPPATAHPSTPPTGSTQSPSSGQTTPGGPRTGSPTAVPPGSSANGASATPGTASPAGQASPSGQARPASARTGTPSAAPAAAAGDQLASTGAGGTELLGAAGLALLIGGGVLYRRARAGAAR
ncbi:chaplin family protein [Kitasatospora sp. NPDC093806]|uniref:chaplin n=1 Tax=Kitasatospora sp. NPDC093806 TaxID=3155075 RepID=UPI00341656F3